MEWSETVHDADWSTEDLAAALEWRYERSLICECGHPIDETTIGEEAPAWIAEPVVCNACAARERKSKADHDGDQQPAPGTKYRTRNRLKPR